ncbi:MAG: IS3 family transposase [Nocardioidaceae bacterium]|nr:IS3 family transposase [Nocardioidaceae bacterium]
MRPSILARRDFTFDNSLAESFFATLQTELLDRRHWKTRAELATAIFDYTERFYNPTRRHSRLGYLSPIAFEAAAAVSGVNEHACETRMRSTASNHQAVAPTPRKIRHLPTTIYPHHQPVRETGVTPDGFGGVCVVRHRPPLPGSDRAAAGPGASNSST